VLHLLEQVPKSVGRQVDDEVRGPQSQHLLARVAEIVADALVHVTEVPIRIEQDDTVRGVLEQPTETLLAGAQSLFRLPAFGDVADDRQHDRRSVEIENAHADLDREPAAVLARVVAFHVPHFTGWDLSEEALPARRVPGRVHVPDRQVENLVAGAAEALATAVVHVDEVAFPIDDIDAVRGALPEAREQRRAAGADPGRIFGSEGHGMRLVLPPPTVEPRVGITIGAGSETPRGYRSRFFGYPRGIRGHRRGYLPQPTRNFQSGTSPHPSFVSK
jgi:hypothetical protein